VVTEVDRDFFWFASEQYYEPEVVDKLRLAHGFCPTHTRHFLATGSHSVTVSVFAYLTWYMIKRLNMARSLLGQKDSKHDPRRLCLQAARVLSPQGSCPMCHSLRHTETIEIDALLAALAIGEVKDAYEKSPGVCIPHLRQAGFLAQWDSFAFLTQDLQRRLKVKLFPGRSTAELLEQTAGLDRESSLRQCTGSGQSLDGQKREIKAAIESGNPPHPWSQTFEATMASLAEPGCPVCVFAAKGVRHYFDWLARQMEAQRSHPSTWDLSWNICPSHLWELNAAGHNSAALLIGEHMVEDWLAKLDRFGAGLRYRPAAQQWRRLYQAVLVVSGGHDAGALEDAPPQNRWKKTAAILESPKDRLDALRSVAFRSDRCQACSHIHTMTQRRLDLILRLLEDPLGRQAYHGSQGLCLRHCVEAAKLAEVPAALDELLSAQIARLRLLEWELEEASRKNNWSIRYEPNGPESEVGRRAAYQFCGVG
jgi:hypothetical protein